MALWILSIIITVLVVYQLAPSLKMSKGQPMTQVDKMIVCFERFDGVSSLEVPNLITDLGENHTRNMAARPDASHENITGLAIGNHSTAANADTVLDSVYGSVQTGTTVVEWENGDGDAAINVTYRWEFAAFANVNATATYTFNTTFAYSIANFASAETFDAGENLTVRWVHIFNGN